MTDGARRHLLRALVAVVATLVLVASLVGNDPLAAAAGPSGAGVQPSLGLTVPRAMVVDPVTNRVFVAGDDRVVVAAPDGTPMGSIPNIPGASGMDVAQGFVWVNESTAGTIAKIDPTTMTVVHSYVVGAAVGDNLAIVGDGAWLGNQLHPGGVQRFDLTTSALITIGNYYGPAARRIPGSTSAVLVCEQWVSPARLDRVSASPPYTVTATAYGDGCLPGLAANGDGTKLWSTTGHPYTFAEFDGTTLMATGTTFEAEPYQRQVAWSPGHGGLVAGVAGRTLYLYGEHAPSPFAKMSLGDSGDGAVLDLALSSAGDRAYILGSDLQVLDLRPAVTATAPASVVQNVPTVVTVTGRALGGTTLVSVGGVSTTPLTTAPEQVTFALPANVPLGTQPVALSDPLGAVSSSIVVSANTGTTLSGTVRVGAVPVPGAEVTLAGGPLVTPIGTVAGPDGTYSIAGLAYGTTYALTVHDPAASAPDQTLEELALTPNAPTSLDVDLSRPAAGGFERRRTTLGGGQVADLVVDPATGDIVVAVGDEVDVLDEQGVMLARFPGQYRVRSLTMLGPDVYAGVAGQGRVTRINLTSLSITGSWNLDRVTNGYIAAAAGKIWFVSGFDSISQIAALDPASGTIGAASGTQFYPALRSVVGAPDEFTVTDQSGTPKPTTLFDGTTDPPTQIARADNPYNPPTFIPAAPFTSIAATGHIYDADGREFTLADLAYDGIQYPGAWPAPYGLGISAFSPGMGGVVAIGATVSRAGVPVATHAFGGTPSNTGLNVAGTLLYTVVGNELVVDDLSPHVTALGPGGVHPATTSVVLQGSGLGAVTAVTIDGSAVPFQVQDAGNVGVTLAGLSVGVHRVVVTTPWGQSVPGPLDVTPLSPPSAPTHPAASLIAGGGRVTWQPPLDDGGVPITGYTATASPGGGSCSTSGALTCDVSGLLASTPYTFTVRASNGRGVGPPSVASPTLFIPPYTTPGAPTGVSVVAGPGNVLVTWSPPHSDGGMPLTVYTVVALEGGSTTPLLPVVVVDGGSTSALYEGLNPKQDYHFYVSASNGMGAGPRSAASATVTVWPLVGSPSPPSAVSGVPGDGSVDVSWSAPASAGDSAVTSYVVSASPGGATCVWTNGPLHCPVAGLTNGTPYTFIVAARNSVGEGWDSDPSVPVTPTTIGSRFHPVPPARIIDSRPAPNRVGPLGSWGAGVTQRVTVVGGLSPVPSSATAVVLNVTATGGSANGDYLSIWPAGAPQPTVSSLNFDPGQTIANQVTVKLGAAGSDAGKVAIFNAGGSANVIVDVNGYYDTTSGGDGFVSLAPTRIIDSRAGSHVGPINAWGPGVTQDVTAVGGLSGVPPDADAVVLNVTATGGTASGDFLSIWPTGTPRPLVSSLNVDAGQSRPNAVTVALGAPGPNAGKISVFNAGGTQHVIIDVAGYFKAGTGTSFYPLAPTRVIDSRPPPARIGPLGAWGPGLTQRLAAIGELPKVPAIAGSVVANITATGGSANGDYLTVWPSGATQAVVSSLNFDAGDTVANAVTVKLGLAGADLGRIAIFNAGGTVNVIVDIAGYYA